MKRHREYICCICGKKKIGWGNNPWPINNEPDAVCCDNCNAFVVIPRRIRDASRKEVTLVAEFGLLGPVNDVGKARAYLLEEDMEDYIRDKGEWTNKITSIDWVLITDTYGYVVVRASEPLTEEEKSEVSDWIRGQNSDGIGEGFEQQAFAEIRMDSDLPFSDEEEVCGVASFDWDYNKYPLKDFDTIPIEDRTDIQNILDEYHQ